MAQRSTLLSKIQASGWLDGLLVRITRQPRLLHRLIPLVRAYVRYCPARRGKQAFWTRVVEPYFAWQSHPFVASTVFRRQLAGNTKDMVQQYIYYFGIWEPDLTRWIQQRLMPGDTFVDIGANVGYYSLLGSACVGRTGQVAAIEASPEIFRALENNLRRNRTRNVRAVNVAASDQEGTVQLFRGPEFNVGQTTVVEQRGLPPEGEIRAAPLGAILSPTEMREARLIKIDVEGAEWCVVAGMEPMLKSGRKDLEVIVELHSQHLAQQGKQPQELMRVFQEAGFNAYRLRNDYWALSYLAPHSPALPERISTLDGGEGLVIFSREDSEQLQGAGRPFIA